MYGFKKINQQISRFAFQIKRIHVLHFKSKEKQVCYWQHIFQHIANVLIYKIKYMEIKDMIDNKCVVALQKDRCNKLFHLRTFFFLEKENFVWLLLVVGNPTSRTKMTTRQFRTVLQNHDVQRKVTNTII